MKRRNRVILARLLATTSIVALSLSAGPVVLHPHIGGAHFAHAESGSSCFVAGTLVLMADGSERPIETLRAGDLVRGAGGRINRVAAVERPQLGARRLYAFNGGTPFVTAEHPFLTMAGWKAVDPAATARENAALRVAALKPGDLLTRACPAAARGIAGSLALDLDVVFSLEVLTVIAAAAADPATVVYNLLLDGDHSYVANGFVVHNKGGEGGDDGGGDDGGDDDGGDDDGGDDGGESGGGGEGGDDGGGEDNSGEGSESGSSGSGSSGESGESGSSGSGSSGSGSSGSGSGRSGSSGETGESGSDTFFSGDPGAADHDLSPSEEADLISRGWQ